MIEEQEVALEGLDREHLRVHDNQKLMPLAMLYREHIETIRCLEDQIFALNSSEAAESWANIERETFDKFRALLLQPEQSDEEYASMLASCAAMLRWANEEEKCQELLERWVAYQKGSLETEGDARMNINDLMTARLKALYALTDFHDGAQVYLRMSKQIRQHQFHEAYETASVFRSILVHEQEQLQNLPLIKREFYANLLAMVDNRSQDIRDELKIDEEESVFRNHPYNPDEVRAILDKIEEEEEEAIKEDEPDEDENAALYERDFEDAYSNKGMFFKMMDAYSGNNVADKILEADDRRRGTVRNTGSKVGRNDLCPCGSERKFKKCCLDQ